MQLSFFKKLKKYNHYLSSVEDVIKYCKYSNREISIDNITPQLANQIDSLIRFWNIIDEDRGNSLNEREPIKIYMDSLGGNLASALTILDSIKMSKTPVYIFNIGVVQKEAFLIYLSGHKRYTYNNSTFMYTPITLEENSNNESNFYNYSNLLTKQKNEIENYIIERTNIIEANFEKHGKNEWWFNTDDALKLKICNEISKTHYYIKQKNK